MRGVSIIIPTYNGGEIFRESLEVISRQRYAGKIQLIVIDSGSRDGSWEAARAAGAEIVHIDSRDFHHSGTRNQGVARADHPYVLMMVQDAIPQTDTWVADMVYSLEEDDVAALCVRQIPHRDADLYAAFTTTAHGAYLGEGKKLQRVRSLQEMGRLSYDEALQRIRFDNVCAMYRRRILAESPFPPVPFGEDVAWVYAQLKKGYQVKYDPTIAVAHSHNRPAQYHFKRAVVDRVNCISLLKKSPLDLSSWRQADLLKLERSMRKIIGPLCETAEKFRPSSPSLSQGVRSNSRQGWLGKYGRAFYRKAMQVAISNGARNLLGFAGEEMLLRLQMRRLLQYMYQLYPDAKEEDVRDCLEKLGASIVGGYWGTAYAGHLLTGTIPRDIAELVEPYMEGI